MAFRPDQIAEAVKTAKEAEKQIKLAESGKSVYFDDKKYTDLHDLKQAIKNKDKK